MATTNPIILPIKTPGLSDLQKLEKRMEALEKDAAKAARTLPKAANGIKKTGRAAATATTNVQRLGVAFRTTLLPITAVLGSLTLLNKALGVTGQRDAELNVLSTGLRGLVDDADAAANALVGAADKLGKQTLFDQEDFTATFKLFTSFRNIGVDAYERVGEAAADIATKLGTAPKEAALQLAKALEDPAKQVTALARSGTVFTDQQKEQIKTLQQSGDLLGAQEIILKEIEKQYGGAAKAAGAAGFAGALDSTGEAWRDFLETLGESNESGAVEFLNGVTKALEFLTRNFDVIAQVARATVDVLLLPFKAMYEGVTSVIGPVENFEATFRQAMAITAKVLTDLTQNVLVPAFRFVGVVIGTIGKWLGQLIVAIGNAANSAVQFVVGAINKIAGVIAGFINQTPAGILLKLFGIDAGGAAAAGLKNFAAGIDGIAVSVKGYKDALLEAGAAALTVEGDGPGVSNPFAGSGPKGANAAGGSGSKGGGGAGKAAADAQKLADKTAERLLTSEKLITAAQREGELLRANSDAEKAQIESMNAMMQIAEKYGELAAKSLSDAETENLLKAQGLEVENERYELEEKLADLRDSAMGGIDDEIAHMEAILAGTEKEYLLRKKIAELQAAGVNGPEAEAKVQRLEQLKLEVAAYEEMEAKVGAVADTIAGSMTDAFVSIIDGSKSAEEAMADMMKDIAKSFIDMAADIIKQQIAMIVKGLIMKALGISMPGASGGGGGAAPQSAAVSAGWPGNLNYEGGGFTGNAPRSGGLDGKGGFAAMLHPQETVIDHTKAMGQYNAGNNSGGGGGAAVPTFKLETRVINGVEYATVDQVVQMGATATKNGAKQGEAKVMNSLKNSRGARARIGV